MSTNRRPHGVLTVALMVLAGACGPTNRIHLGLRDYATNVVYGNQHKPEPPKALPGAALEPSFPTFIQPLLPPPAASTPPPAVVLPKCASAGFSIPAKYPVTPGVPAPPHSAILTFHQDGYFAVAG